jgi:hypothetical protein
LNREKTDRWTQLTGGERKFRGLICSSASLRHKDEPQRICRMKSWKEMYVSGYPSMHLLCLTALARRRDELSGVGSLKYQVSKFQQRSRKQNRDLGDRNLDHQKNRYECADTYTESVDVIPPSSDAFSDSDPSISSTIIESFFSRTI